MFRNSAYVIGRFSALGILGVVSAYAETTTQFSDASGVITLRGEPCTGNSDCDDGYSCTDDLCNGGTGECANTPEDALCNVGEICDPSDPNAHPLTGCVSGFICTSDDECDDVLFCTGMELCDPTNPEADPKGCYSSGDPCTETTPVCNESVNACEACDSDSDCDDGFDCTQDICNRTTGECSNLPIEGCEACGANSECDDGYSCTDDLCNGVTGECTSTANNANCNPGEICDPTDPSTDPVTGCFVVEPCASNEECDDGLFCTGTELCDPTNPEADPKGCYSSGDPCSETTPVCNESVNACEACDSDSDCDDEISCTDDKCKLKTGECAHQANDSHCASGQVCDPENPDADPSTGCVGGDFCDSNSDCNDGIDCTVDFCDGITGECHNNADNSLCTDPLFCDGADICDPTDPNAGFDGCYAPGSPCGGSTPLCDESTDTCFACEGDANGDAIVDPLDSGYVQARFGCTVGAGDTECDAADVNHDVIVDPLDVGFVLSRFGECP